MSRFHLFILPALLVLLILQTACGSTRSAQDDSETTSHGGQVIKMEDVQAMGYSSIEEVLVSRVPGVRWAPGGGIIIRGTRSIQGSNEPLYVVDGIPSSARPTLSLTDVEEVEVLKDAATLSRYGSRGQNGAVLIRTKKPSD